MMGVNQPKGNDMGSVSQGILIGGAIIIAIVGLWALLNGGKRGRRRK